MTFSNWPVLFALFIPASILTWIWLRDRLPELGLGSDRRVALPQDHGTTGSGRWKDILVKTFLSSAPLMLATAIILMAGPMHLGVPKSERELTNIEFCLDLSGSMTAEFGSVTRYDAAMAALNGFVEQRSGDAFGLTVFGSDAQHWIPLTTDPSAFRCATPFLNPSFNLPPGYGGGTMIGLGLRKCQDVLVTRERGDRMIILISDGQSFDLGNGQEEELGKSLRDDNIVVHSIHIGGGNTPASVSTITNIALGESFSPDNVEALKGVFNTIDKMQVARMKQSYAELLDWFAPFSIAGLSFVGVTLCSLVGMRYTPW